MHSKPLALAAGVFALLASGWLLPGAGRTVQGQAGGGQPRFVNARVETVPGADLTRAFADAVTARRTPGWIAYSVPGVPGEHHMCESDRHPARAYLEGRPANWRADDSRKEASAEKDIVVLVRADAGRAQKVRVYSTDCELDAGGLPVTWLTGVSGAASVALLRGMVAGDGKPADVAEQAALTAIAFHADPSATRALESFTASGHPAEVRKRAAFWLGAARGGEGFDVLRRLVAGSTDEDFREQLVFPVSLSHRPEAVDLLIRLAHDDRSPEVRKQAMFWLGTKAGDRSAATLADAAANDPDTEVKKRAVFALSRMKDGEGVARLIEVARANRNPEVRRSAMFWLGRSNDPRALAFLEDFLKK